MNARTLEVIKPEEELEEMSFLMLPASAMHKLVHYAAQKNMTVAQLLQKAIESIK